jgi:hypothetical protein
MFKKIVLFAFVCLSSLPLLRAQDFQPYAIGWSPKLKVPAMQDIEILRADANYIYYVSNGVMDENLYSGGILTTKAHMYRCDRKTGECVDRELVFKNGDTHRAFEKVVMMGNVVHVFTSFVNTDQKKYYIFEETLGTDSLEFKNNVRKVAELDYGVLNHAGASSMFTKYVTIRNRLLIQSKVTTQDGYFTTNDIFDASMNKKASYNYQSVGKDFKTYDCTIDYNDGLYVLNSFTNTKNEPCFDLYFYSKDTTEVRKQSFTGLQMVGTTRMAVNPKNELIVAGLFAKANQASAIGTFSIVFPTALTGVGKLNSTNFTDEFLTSGYDKKEAAELLKDIHKNKEFNDQCSYIIDSIDVRENGDFSFVSEKQKIVVKTTYTPSYSGPNGSYSSGSSKTTYYYTYGDAYVCSYRADGSLKWSRNLAKDVELVDMARFNGHYIPYRTKDGSINLILTSYKENKSIILKWLGLNGLKADKTNIVSFDADGKRQDKLLIADSKITKKLIPIYSKCVDERNFLMTCLEWQFIKFNYSVGTMTFK